MALRELWPFNNCTGFGTKHAIEGNIESVSSGSRAVRFLSLLNEISPQQNGDMTV
jgi:hypothetical protein